MSGYLFVYFSNLNVLTKVVCSAQSSWLFQSAPSEPGWSISICALCMIWSICERLCFLILASERMGIDPGDR